MTQAQFRNKIYWFSFIFSMLVIWVHSYNAELYLGVNLDGSYIDEIEHFFGRDVAQIAVPGFFMISSYLFFRNFKIERLWYKWNSRIKSILIPYILWNSLYYLGYVTASRIPWLSEVVGKGIIPISLSEAANAVLHYEYNYVFWYLHQLIQLIILAPVIYKILTRKYLKYIYVILLLFALHQGMVLSWLNLDALLFYSAAAWAAIYGKDLYECQWSQKRCKTGVAVLACSVLVYLYAIRWYSVFGIAIYRLTMPAALWLLADESKLPPAKSWMKINFFIYAVHFGIVRFINKVGAMLLPVHLWTPFIIYLLMPITVVLISYGLSLLLKRHMKPVWRLLNGERE